MIPETGQPDEIKAALLCSCQRMPQVGEVFQFGGHLAGEYQAEYLYTVHDSGVPKFAFVVHTASVDTWEGMLVYVRERNWLELVENRSIRFVYNIIDDHGIYIESAHRA